MKVDADPLWTHLRSTIRGWIDPTTFVITLLKWPSDDVFIQVLSEWGNHPSRQLRHWLQSAPADHPLLHQRLFLRMKRVAKSAGIP